MPGNDVKRLWERFKRWYAPWEPIKLQPTSLSRTVVPPLDVIKAEIDPEGRMRLKRVWHLALMRLLGLGVWSHGIVVHYATEGRPWGKFFTTAPQRLRQSVEPSKIVKAAGSPSQASQGVICALPAPNMPR